MPSFIKFILLCLVAALASGCSKLTPENFAKIATGAQYAEVVAILGEPSRCDVLLVAKSCVWGDDKKKIDIKFVSDKVVLASSQGL